MRCVRRASDDLLELTSVVVNVSFSSSGSESLV